MNKRQADMLQTLQEAGEASVAAMARRFGVTQATIRRDFQYLEDAGHLVRAHGSAIPSPTSVAQLAYSRKSQAGLAQKRAIGNAVAAEVKPGMTVALDTGTTTLEVARAISKTPNIRVLTTSLPIAAALHAYEHLQVILMGGIVRRNDPDLSGALTEENLRRFKSDLAVMGSDAANQDGLFTADMATARGAQAMLSGAKRSVLTIDSSKFAATGLFRYAQWSDFACVYTDSGVSRQDANWLGKLKAQIIYVPV